MFLLPSNALWASLVLILHAPSFLAIVATVSMQILKGQQNRSSTQDPLAHPLASHNHGYVMAIADPGPPHLNLIDKSSGRHVHSATV